MTRSAESPLWPTAVMQEAALQQHCCHLTANAPTAIQRTFWYGNEQKISTRRTRCNGVSHKSVTTFTGLLCYARASSVRDVMDIPLLIWLPDFHGNNTICAWHHRFVCLVAWKPNDNLSYLILHQQMAAYSWLLHYFVCPWCQSFFFGGGGVLW